MATVNSIYYNSQGKQLFIDNNTNQFVISGYRLTVDPSLNRDLLIVNTPSTTGSQGQKGNIAFDDHHIYYCVGTNSWVRGKLARWGTIGNTIVESPNIQNPTNWWNFTSPLTTSNDIIGNYNFSASTYNNPASDAVSFSINSGFVNPKSWGCLSNFTSNLIEPSTLNENFSISFEIKRLNNGFIMGNPFGKLGFHFEFTNSGITSAGEYLTFSLGAHTDQNPYNQAGYRWVRARSSNIISNTNYTQVIATNNASTKEIKLYINGVLNATTSYTGTPLGSKYNNPSYKGWGIGASTNGSWTALPVNAVEYYNYITIKSMGFWKGKLLTGQDISYLYNDGNFRRYPFV